MLVAPGCGKRTPFFPRTPPISWTRQLPKRTLCLCRPGKVESAAAIPLQRRRWVITDPILWHRMPTNRKYSNQINSIMVEMAGACGCWMHSRVRTAGSALRFLWKLWRFIYGSCGSDTDCRVFAKMARAPVLRLCQCLNSGRWRKPQALRNRSCASRCCDAATPRSDMAGTEAIRPASPGAWWLEPALPRYSRVLRKTRKSWIWSGVSSKAGISA